MAGNDVSIFGAGADNKTPFNLEKLTDQFRTRKSDWTIPQAFLCVLLSATVADGHLDAEEHNTVMALISRSRALSSLNANELAKANDIVNERLRTRSNGLQEACQSLPQEMRLSAFAHCVDLILADGELLKSEAEFLQRLMGMLEIDETTARTVMEVLLAKNQY